MNEENPERSGNLILIVEDSPTQAEKLKYMLEKHDYLVTAAANGREALTILEVKKPIAVISDIVMPDMDGYELCHRIKGSAELRDIPVILLTSLSAPEDVILGLECGADFFIMKPYNELFLLSRIQHILANRNLNDVHSVQMGLEIFFRGKKYFINSDRLQILNLLLSTFETAIQKNGELINAQDELKSFNAQLEQMVLERTAALAGEIMEHKRTEERLRQSQKFTSDMNRIAHVFLTVADEEIYGEVLKLLLEIMGSRFGLFGFIDDKGDLVIPSMSREIWNECQVPDKTIVFTHATWGESLWGRAIRERKSFYANTPFQAPLGHLAIDNFLTTPIIFADKCIGLISVANSAQG